MDAFALQYDTFEQTNPLALLKEYEEINIIGEIWCYSYRHNATGWNFANYCIIFYLYIPLTFNNVIFAAQSTLPEWYTGKNRLISIDTFMIYSLWS